MSVDNAGGSHASGAGEEKFDLNELIAGLKANESAKERYEVLGALGKGKFSTVYRARCGSQVMALKKVQIFEMMDARSREKCLREIKLLQSLNHPNIIRYIDSYIDNNELIIVLEFAEGGDLKGLIKRVRSSDRVFEEAMIWNYAEQITAGLQHMHAKRIMHRDLKPANIMLTMDNQIKLGDLGLGRYFTSQTLEAFSKVGTPLYMSAEVLQGNGYTFSADIWSLGCVLYELCMLRSPFKTDKAVNLYELFQKIKNGQYEPIDERYSAPLRTLINSMINLIPERRPPVERIAAYIAHNNPFKPRPQQPPSSRPASAITLDAVQSGTDVIGSPVFTATGNTDSAAEMAPLEFNRPGSGSQFNNNSNVLAAVRAAVALSPPATSPPARPASGGSAPEYVPQPPPRVSSGSSSRPRVPSADTQPSLHSAINASQARVTSAASRAAVAAADADLMQQQAANPVPLLNIEQNGINAAVRPARPMSSSRAKRAAQPDDSVRIVEDAGTGADVFDSARGSRRSHHSSKTATGATQPSVPVSFVNDPTSSNTRTLSAGTALTPSSQIKPTRPDRPGSTSQPDRQQPALPQQQQQQIVRVPSALIMEEIIDHLKLLDYEHHFCRRYKWSPLSPLFFAEPLSQTTQAASSSRTTTHQSPQFAYFSALSAWLITVCGEPPPSDILMDAGSEQSVDAHTAVSSLMRSLAKMGLVPDVPPVRLKAACGFEVCVLLMRLLNAALRYRNFAPLQPIHEKTVDSDEPVYTNQDEAQIDDDEEVADEVDSDADPAEQSANDRIRAMSSGHLADESRHFIEPSVEAEMWLKEHARLLELGSFAHAPSTDVDQWRTHTNIVTSLVPSFHATAQVTAAELLSRIAQLKSTTESIQNAELKIQSQFKPLADEYYTRREDARILEHTSSDLVQAVEQCNLTLNEIEDRAQLVQEEHASRQDNTMLPQLQQGRATLANLRKEIVAMELRIGCAAHVTLKRI